MNRRYWTLLAIAAAEGKPLTPVQLQKSLFLFGERIQKKPKNFYNFTPYNFGPFDSSVYHDADALEAEGLIIIRQAPGQRWKEYVVSPSGLARVKELESEIPARSANFLKKVVAWTRQFGFQELVRHIYRLYPEYRAQSIFRD